MQRIRDYSGLTYKETFDLSPGEGVTNNVEVEVNFDLETGSKSQPRIEPVCPLKNGWARPIVLTTNTITGEYQLGNWIGDSTTLDLALPMVYLPMDEGSMGVFADPRFSALFSLGFRGGRIQASIRFAYDGRKVPIKETEHREFAIWLPKQKAAFCDAVNAWFRLLLPDVPPGPEWLHRIAMVDYDFLSDQGMGWERDLHALAGWLKPQERRRVAVCLHGWYDALGSYCFDRATGKMKESWVAFAPTRHVELNQGELKRRLSVASHFGFRVLLYFGDGLAADSGVPGFQEDWAYHTPDGKKIDGWKGPDTFDTTYLMNPAHPAVFSFFTNYMAALLRTYGTEVDGFVWDETFHARAGQTTRSPYPAYCDRAMLDLVQCLAAEVHRFDKKKVFLVSDCVGGSGLGKVPGYAIVADGTYQDSHCDSDAWSYGLFPNWRNVLWSCNWDSITGFHRTRWGVEKFGVPVAVSNGWGDDRGPSEWSGHERSEFLNLFRTRLKAPAGPRFLSLDPALFDIRAPDRPCAGDSKPSPGPTEVNWALSSNGSTAAALSCDDSGTNSWRAAGVIDGSCTDSGWGGGHGWQSKKGEPLPQWIEVNLPEEKPINRFVIINYQKENSSETAGKWGNCEYDIQVWHQGRWEPVVHEIQPWPCKTRVHNLPAPLKLSRFRFVATRVMPLDGQARLLQLEAWGPP